MQQSTSTHTKHFHNIQQLNNNYIQTYCELFHQIIHKHATHKTRRFINRVTHKIHEYTIPLTTTQIQEALKQSKNNNSRGPAKLNVRHLKHISLLGLAFLTSMLKTALNTNIIPHMWKLAPHTCPYPPLSNCKDTVEEHSSLHNSKHTKHTHATRVHNTFQ